MGKTVKVVSILLVVLIALSFNYVYAQQPYAESLDEISSRLPGNWDGFEQLSKDVIGDCLNVIWTKQEGVKYRHFQVMICKHESEVLEASRQQYEDGQLVRYMAEQIPEALDNASESTHEIDGSKVFTLTSASPILQIELYTCTSGIYHNYAIVAISYDGPQTSSEIWKKVIDLIGEKAEEPEEPQNPKEPEEAKPELDEEPPPPAEDETSEAAKRVLVRLDEAEQATLEALLKNERSFLNSAVESKVWFGFAIGQLMEKYGVDLPLLKAVISPASYSKLDKAYDLDKIDSLRNYCKNKDFKGFSQKYKQYAAQTIEDEHSFSKAEEKVKAGFNELRHKVEHGDLPKDTEGAPNELDMIKILLEYKEQIEFEMFYHFNRMGDNQKSAKYIIESTAIIDTLTNLADKLFGGQLNKVRISSALAKLWSLNQSRHWPTTVYIWGGTDKMKQNRFEEIRREYNLFPYQEIYYGIVYFVETGLDKLFKGEPLPKIPKD